MRKIKDLISLKNRKALVTGACGHLGSAICETLAEQGCDLILLDLPGSNFSKLSNRISTDYKVSIQSVEADLEDELSTSNAIKVIISLTKNLNVIVNNAAFVSSRSMQGWSDVFEKQSIGAWNRAINVNLTSVFQITRDLSPLLKNSEKASIINIGSIYGLAAPDYSLYKGTDMGNPAAYAASKGGLIQLTKWLSSTLAKEIRVNCISPGGIIRDQPKEFIEKYISKTPLKRMAIEEDFKGAIAYLSSDLSDYVTGHNIIIDGGWTS